MNATPVRVPNEFCDLIDDLQGTLFKRTGVLPSKTDCIRIFAAIATIDQAKLRQVVEQMTAKKKLRKSYAYLFEG